MVSRFETAFNQSCSFNQNSLSDDVVCAPSVPVFKCRLVRFLLSNGGFTNKF